jgi:hypothetical protein
VHRPAAVAFTIGKWHMPAKKTFVSIAVTWTGQFSPVEPPDVQTTSPTWLDMLSRTGIDLSRSGSLAKTRPADDVGMSRMSRPAFLCMALPIGSPPSRTSIPLSAQCPALSTLVWLEGPLPSRMARAHGSPLCQGVVVAGIGWVVAGSGCGLSEGPVSGVSSVALDCRVVPDCPPGPAASRRFWSASMRA